MQIQAQTVEIESVTREDIMKSMLSDNSLVLAIGHGDEDFLNNIEIVDIDKNKNGLPYYMFDRSVAINNEGLIKEQLVTDYDSYGNPVSVVKKTIVRPQLLWSRIIPHMGSESTVLEQGSFVFFDLIDDRSTNIAKNFKVRFYILSPQESQSIKQYDTTNGGKTAFYRPDYICDRIQYVFSKTNNRDVGQGDNKVSESIKATSFSGRSPITDKNGYYGCTFTMDCTKVRCGTDD